MPTQYFSTIKCNLPDIEKFTLLLYWNDNLRPLQLLSTVEPIQYFGQPKSCYPTTRINPEPPTLIYEPWTFKCFTPFQEETHRPQVTVLRTSDIVLLILTSDSCTIVNFRRHSSEAETHYKPFHFDNQSINLLRL